MGAEREYLVVYDYGMGGVWAVMTAPSKPAVESAYPGMAVFEERPPWMTTSMYRRIKSHHGFSFDEPDDWWMQFFQPRS